MSPLEAEDDVVVGDLEEEFAHVRFFRGLLVGLLFSAALYFLGWEVVKWLL